MRDTFSQNLLEACVETCAMIAVYALATTANGEKSAVNKLRTSRALAQWLALFTLCNALLKTVNPKLDNSFVSAAMINAAGLFLAPFKK